MPSSQFHAARRQLESVANGTVRVGRWRIGKGVAASLGVTIAIAGGTVAYATLPSKGPVPFGRNGSIDWPKVPDFISVTAGDKIVGYAPRADVLPMSGADTGAAPVPVYKADLRTLVGHVYSGIGSVPLGQSPQSVPCSPEWITEGTLTRPIPCQSVSITLPDVVGMSTPSAAGELSGLGVSVNVVNVPSDSVPNGQIVAMSPHAGAVVHARSIVTINNSVEPKR